MKLELTPNQHAMADMIVEANNRHFKAHSVYPSVVHVSTGWWLWFIGLEVTAPDCLAGAIMEALSSDLDNGPAVPPPPTALVIHGAAVVVDLATMSVVAMTTLGD